MSDKKWISGAIKNIYDIIYAWENGGLAQSKEYVSVVKRISQGVTTGSENFVLALVRLNQSFKNHSISYIDAITAIKNARLKDIEKTLQNSVLFSVWLFREGFLCVKTDTQNGRGVFLKGSIMIEFWLNKRKKKLASAKFADLLKTSKGIILMAMAKIRHPYKFYVQNVMEINTPVTDVL